MEDKRKKKVYDLFTSCWKLFSKYHFTAGEWERGKDKGRWERCAEEARQIVEAHGREAMQVVCDTMELVEGSEREALKGISQYRLDPPVPGSTEKNAP